MSPDQVNHEQLVFFDPEPRGPREPRALVPVPGREEPMIWIRRLVIWHDVAGNSVRDISLRRGLNIVWSPSDGVASVGHAAGKTLLCRMLRFCLGEDTFADSSDTDAIQLQFPQGAVGAEVRVARETWCVRRGFRRGADQAARLEGLEQLDSAGGDTYHAFLQALQRAVFHGEVSRTLPELDGLSPWHFGLAWLTRDQESRLSNLHEWRHADTGSQSRVRGSSLLLRKRLLRILLGLYPTEALKAQSEVDGLESVKQQQLASGAAIKSDLDTFRREIARALRRPPESIWPPPSELEREAHRQDLISAAKSLALGATKAQEHPDEAKLLRWRLRIADLDPEIGRLGQECQEVNAQVDLLTEQSADFQRDYREAKHPVCPYYRVPVGGEESETACPYLRPSDIDALKKRAAEEEERQKAARREYERLASCLSDLRKERFRLLRRIRRRAPVVNAWRADRDRQSQDAFAVRGWILRLFELDEELGKSEQLEAQAKRQVDEARSRLKGALAACSLDGLQTWFDELVQLVLEPPARGRLYLEDDGLKAKFEWQGSPRRSGAFDSLRVVLFDLAAMLYAAEGRASSPAFLVHDSPREGDLAKEIYNRLFAAVLGLWEDQDSAPFQYILTTTTEPPEGPARGRVQLELHGGIEAGRLLRKHLFPTRLATARSRQQGGV